MRKRILVLVESVNPWHTFWIRFGQYIQDLNIDIDLCTTCEAHNGKLFGIHNGVRTPPLGPPAALSLRTRI